MTGSVDRFLAGKAQTRRARLIFALDATASRQPTWDLACTLQAKMFAETVGLGALEVQLVYFRGLDGFDGECKSSIWMAPAQLTAMMQKIQCRAGHTQIGKVLDHVRRETQQQPVGALVFVGDAMEENVDALVARAGGMGVPAFMFQENNPNVFNFHLVERAYKAIAYASHGAYAPFDANAAAQLHDLLAAVLAFVIGGVTALAARKDETSIKLLSQLK